MGFGGISIWQIGIVLVLIVVFFGGKRLRNLGKDLGHSIKDFSKAVKNEDKNNSEK